MELAYNAVNVTLTLLSVRKATRTRTPYSKKMKLHKISNELIIHGFRQLISLPISLIYRVILLILFVSTYEVKYILYTYPLPSCQLLKTSSTTNGIPLRNIQCSSHKSKHIAFLYLSFSSIFFLLCTNVGLASYCQKNVPRDCSKTEENGAFSDINSRENSGMIGIQKQSN